MPKRNMPPDYTVNSDEAALSPVTSLFDRCLHPVIAVVKTGDRITGVSYLRRLLQYDKGRDTMSKNKGDHKDDKPTKSDWILEVIPSGEFFDEPSQPVRWLSAGGSPDPGQTRYSKTNGIASRHADSGH